MAFMLSFIHVPKSYLTYNPDIKICQLKTVQYISENYLNYLGQMYMMNKLKIVMNIFLKLITISYIIF